MFGIGSKELILILIIAFVIVGPQDLPKVARALGRAVRWGKGILDEIKRETGMDELEKEFKEEARSLDKTIRQADIRQDLRKTQLELNSTLSDIKNDMTASPAPSVPGSSVPSSRKGPSFAEFKQQRAKAKQPAAAAKPEEAEKTEIQPEAETAAASAETPENHTEHS